MPDISMCSGEGCPFREKCYRSTATPSEYMQSWFTTPPVVGVECDYFWPNEEKARVNWLNIHSAKQESRDGDTQLPSKKKK